MQVAAAEIGGKVGFRDAVDVAVQDREQRFIAFADGDADILHLAGEKAGDQRAAGVIDVIFHHGAVAHGKVHLFALHGLEAFARRVEQKRIFIG